MEPKVGFLEEAAGQSSNTRLMVLVIMVNGIVQSNAVLASGLYAFIKYGGDITAIALTAGGLIASASTVAMVWKNWSKSEETKANTPA